MGNTSSELIPYVLKALRNTDDLRDTVDNITERVEIMLARENRHDYQDLEEKIIMAAQEGKRHGLLDYKPPYILNTIGEERLPRMPSRNIPPRQSRSVPQLGIERETAPMLGTQNNLIRIGSDTQLHGSNSVMVVKELYLLEPIGKRKSKPAPKPKVPGSAPQGRYKPKPRNRK